MANITGFLFVLLTVLCLFLIFKGLTKTLKRIDHPKSKQIINVYLLSVIIWGIVLSLLSYTGILSDFSTFPPYMIIVLVIPLIAIVRLSFSPKFSNIIAHVPTSWLIYIQMFRVVVELLLWMLFLDQLLPIQMTFEGRNWDILVGLTAPIAVVLYKISGKYKKSVLMIWNVMGLLLLLNIVVIALLSMPTPVRQFMNEPANTIVATFPFVFLPGFLVPLAYSMHIFSLKQLVILKQEIKLAN